MSHYAVRITSKGYHVLASYNTRQEAVKHVLADPLRVGGCVYRDGETGKRYCPNECRNLGE